MLFLLPSFREAASAEVAAVPWTDREFRLSLWTKARRDLFIFMSKDTSQVLSIVQRGKNVRGPVNNCSLRVYNKHGIVTFLASRGINFPELTFLEGQHSSRYPTHLNLVSSELETWASRLTEPHRPMRVFSCIPAKYESKKEAGMASTHPPHFPECPKL